MCREIVRRVPEWNSRDPRGYTPRTGEFVFAKDLDDNTLTVKAPSVPHPWLESRHLFQVFTKTIVFPALFYLPGEDPYATFHVNTLWKDNFLSPHRDYCMSEHAIQVITIKFPLRQNYSPQSKSFYFVFSSFYEKKAVKSPWKTSLKNFWSSSVNIPWIFKFLSINNIIFISEFTNEFDGEDSEH